MIKRLDAWLEERIGHHALIREALDEPIPGGARWSYVFGSALTLVFLVQVVTGILLMTSYAPSATTAWSSVHYISFELRAGWIVRGLHHFGSQAMVVLLGAHLFQVALVGAYRRPREINWWLGLVLMATTLGFALTGYLLPWDQTGYWATQVATNIAGTTPLIGGWLQRVIQCGSEYGNLTLTRFHALHVGVLPALLAGTLALHVALFRKHGITAPASADRSVVDRFYPRQVWKDLAAALVVLAVIFALTGREHGAPLDAPANPASDYPARPEWYFLPLFQLLKYFHGPLEAVGTMGVPAIAAAYLVFLPLLDKAKTNALRPRLRVLSPLFAGGLGVVLFTALAMRDDARDPAFQAARVKADARAKAASAIAMNGVPAEGPLAMMARDPETRGEELFAARCAPCHVLGDLGDRKKATATTLDGWGTEAWVLAMLHDPDDDARFGKTPFAGMMPSMDTPPKDRKPDYPPFKAMRKEDMSAAAAFLASQGGEEEAAKRDPALLKQGETIVTTRCTTCHLWKGEGDDSSQGFAPEFSGYGSVAWIKAQITNPATKATYRDDALDPKMKGHMPRFDAELSPADIELLARWVHAHARLTAPAGVATLHP